MPVRKGQLLGTFRSEALEVDLLKARAQAADQRKTADALNALRVGASGEAAELRYSKDYAAAKSKAETAAADVLRLEARQRQVRELRAPRDGTLIAAPRRDDAGKLYDRGYTETTVSHIVAATGTSKALGAGLGWLPSIMIGVVTAVGGGMIRDIAVGRVPLIFGGNTLYATGAVVGSLQMAVLHEAGRPNWGMAASILTAATLTVLARRRGWRLPGAGEWWGTEPPPGHERTRRRRAADPGDGRGPAAPSGGCGGPSLRVRSGPSVRRRGGSVRRDCRHA